MAKVITGLKGVGGFGWRPELPKLKDFKFRASPMMATPLPPQSPDRRALGHNADVINQGDIGSCVGCSSTYGVGFLRRTDKDKLSTNYSALQLYYDARIRDGQQWETVDAGAYIRDAMDSLRETGVAPAKRWPYVEKKFSKKPPANVYREAARWKLGSHWRCNTVDEMMKAIAAGCALVGGLAWYASMSTPEVDHTGILPIPKAGDSLEGGHALYFDMYDQPSRMFRFQNSWGESWGDRGYGYVPFQFLANPELADDFWAMSCEAPETTPWKD